MIGSFAPFVLRVYATAFIAVLLACAPAHEAHPGNSTALVEREIELGDFFGGVDPEDATFVVLKAASGEIVRYNPSRAKRASFRRRPSRSRTR